MGESIDVFENPEPTPVVPPVIWTTITDSITGAPNCVAIFDGTVNAYPGMCAQESDTIQVYEN
jgi:hypothetical protein